MLGSATTKLAHPFAPVKPLPVNTQLPLISDSMTPHSKVHRIWLRGNRDVLWKRTLYYGVSWAQRVLSPGLLRKRFNLIQQLLKGNLGLTPKQREVVVSLLRLWAYYGQVYPTVAHLCREANCSKSTALRVLKELEHLGLIEVVCRNLQPYRRQISNLYLLHGLLLLIARYLAEHGQAFTEKWLQPMLSLPGSVFWRTFLSAAPAGGDS